MRFPRDLVEMLAGLGAAEVRFLVVGGHAVGLHARPRSTKDLDVWLDPARPNVERASDALLALGVPASIAEALRSARLDDIVWIGRAPARVDFLLAIPGAEFGPSWRRRVEVKVDGVAVPVIGRDDLLANKRAV